LKAGAPAVPAAFGLEGRGEGERRSYAVAAAAVAPTALGPEKWGRRGIAAVAAAVPTTLRLENMKGRSLLLPPPLVSLSRSDSKRRGGVAAAAAVAPTTLAPERGREGRLLMLLLPSPPH
jgi:hypothetical protein